MSCDNGTSTFHKAHLNRIWTYWPESVFWSSQILNLLYACLVSTAPGSSATFTQTEHKFSLQYRCHGTRTNFERIIRTSFDNSTWIIHYAHPNRIAGRAGLAQRIKNAIERPHLPDLFGCSTYFQGRFQKRRSHLAELFGCATYFQVCFENRHLNFP